MEYTGNLILDRLESSVAEQIIAASTPRNLPLNTVLMRPNVIPANLVFLTSGMASLVIYMSDGDGAEVGMLGSESITGFSTLLGADTNHPQCVMQIAGTGLSVSRRLLLQLIETSTDFRAAVHQLAQSRMNISAQLSACPLRHYAEARFSRWLLTASDRTNSPHLEMTQEFLAQMLGTRRTTVSGVASSLQDRGLIQYGRGSIEIIDRDGLLATACECYEICRKSMYPPLPERWEPSAD